MRLPNVKKPCKDCPFRKDGLKGWLGKERITEIIDQNSFVCHKKTDLQCAGHMILNKDKNVFYRVAGRMGLNLELSGNELIFNTKQECVNHHCNEIEQP